MSTALFAAAPTTQHLLAHAGHAGGGSVLPGVLVLLLAAAALLVIAALRSRAAQGKTRVEP